MNLREALKELNEGKKIKRKSDSSDLYYQFKDGSIVSGGVSPNIILLDYKDLTADVWEVVEEDILTKKEKEYLENFLLPYADNYNFVFRKTKFNNHYYLRIALIPYDEGSYEIEYINLPLYRLNEPAFAKLEEDYCYTVDDLKLFKE